MKARKINIESLFFSSLLKKQLESTSSSICLLRPVVKLLKINSQNGLIVSEFCMDETQIQSFRIKTFFVCITHCESCDIVFRLQRRVLK